jgi:hypothetical protein
MWWKREEEKMGRGAQWLVLFKTAQKVYGNGKINWNEVNKTPVYLNCLSFFCLKNTTLRFFISYIVKKTHFNAGMKKKIQPFDTKLNQ